MTLNKCQLIGRLGKDPEVRRLNGGDRVVTFSLATSERWKDKNGERQERVEWHSIVIFNEKLGEIAENFLSKGSQVYIEGKLQTRKWEKDGVDRYTTEVVLQKFGGDIRLLGSKEDRELEPAGKVQRGAARPKTTYDELDDDIPFARSYPDETLIGWINGSGL